MNRPAHTSAPADTAAAYSPTELVITLLTAELNGIDLDLAAVLGETDREALAIAAVQYFAAFLSVFPEPAWRAVLERWGLATAQGAP